MCVTLLSPRPTRFKTSQRCVSIICQTLTLASSLTPEMEDPGQSQSPITVCLITHVIQPAQACFKMTRRCWCKELRDIDYSRNQCCGELLVTKEFDILSFYVHRRRLSCSYFSCHIVPIFTSTKPLLCICFQTPRANIIVFR